MRDGIGRFGIGRFATIGLALFVVSGCSGGSGSAGSSAAATPAASAPASNGDTTSGDASVATPGAQPASAAAATPEPAGGGTAAGICDLVTKDELAQIFGVPSVTTTVFAGPPDSCIVESADSDALVAWSLTLAQARVLYDTFALTSQSTAVSGIGDKAAFVENTGLMVLKGDALLIVSLSSGVGDLSEEEQTELAKQVASKAASRM